MGFEDRLELRRPGGHQGVGEVEVGARARELAEDRGPIHPAAQVGGDEPHAREALEYPGDARGARHRVAREGHVVARVQEEDEATLLDLFVDREHPIFIDREALVVGVELDALVAPLRDVADMGHRHGIVRMHRGEGDDPLRHDPR
jgi:hypothetical protein